MANFLIALRYSFDMYPQLTGSGTRPVQEAPPSDSSSNIHRGLQESTPQAVTYDIIPLGDEAGLVEAQHRLCGTVVRAFLQG